MEMIDLVDEESSCRVILAVQEHGIRQRMRGRAISELDVNGIGRDKGVEE